MSQEAQLTLDKFVIVPLKQHIFFFAPERVWFVIHLVLGVGLDAFHICPIAVIEFMLPAF